MKKIILSVLVLASLMVVMGGVSALDGIDFTYPLSGANVSGSSVATWNNTNSTTNLFLQYKQGDCAPGTWTDLLGAMGGSTLSYAWNTTSVIDGDYCLRLQIGSDTKSSTGVFKVDNLDPTATIVKTGSQIEGEIIYFNGSSSTDSGGTGVNTYAWDFGDGDTDTGVAVNHTFAAGTWDVVLTVTDYAGNTDTETVEVVIAAVTYETDAIAFEAEIKGALDLAGSFDTGITSVACTLIGTNPGLTVGQSGTNCTLTWNTIPYADRGEQVLSIKATDGVSSTKYYKANLTVYTWQIGLVEGWNLISIPMMPESTDIDDVFDSIIDNVVYEDTSTASVFQYDATASKWYRARPTSTHSSFTYVTGQSSSELETVVPGYGYWVNMDSADTLKGYGDMNPSMGGAMIGIDIANGWNLIGTYGINSTGMPVADALTSLTLGSTNYYDVVNTNSSGKMFRYEGYWMTAKFLPNGETTYTASQFALDSVL